MKYTAKTFTVPASGPRKDACTHGWLDPRGRCVLCGAVTLTTLDRVNNFVPVSPGFKAAIEDATDARATERRLTEDFARQNGYTP